MTLLKAWIQLIRPVNIILLAITQYFIDIFILQPNFSKFGMYFSLNVFQFFLLVFSTCLICASGYIINDYFDVKIDSVNKPDKQIIGKYISPANALSVYWILTGIAFAVALYLSIFLHKIQLITVQGICIVLLWFYSVAYKKIPLLGNIIVASLAAISILIIGVYEPHLYNLEREGDYYGAGLCWKLLLGVALFSFLLTLVREIIKDMEDYEGDRIYSVKSIPVAWGMRAAKAISFSIMLIVIIIFLILTYRAPDTSKNYLYYAAVLGIFFIYTAYLLLTARRKTDFTALSLLIKIDMLAGIFVLPLYYFTQF